MLLKRKFLPLNLSLNTVEPLNWTPPIPDKTFDLEGIWFIKELFI